MEYSDLILTYEDINDSREDSVGLKALNLIKCYKSQFSVPRGVVLETRAFAAYNKKQLSDLLFYNIEHFFSDVDKLIVRSSTLEEDQADASYAGQYLSLICENSAKAIKTACEACWLSYSSLKVEAYNGVVRFANPKPTKRGMALLIQELVNATASGICFTKGPRNNDARGIVINAVHGLGSVLAEDEVVSDHYEFDYDKKELSVITSGLQRQWRSPNDPEKLMPLAQDLLGKPAISEDQIANVGRIAIGVSKLFKRQMDIEWAFNGEEFFLLQARPITSVAKQREVELWTRDNVADVIPDAVTPLTWALVESATNKGFSDFALRTSLSDAPLTLFKLFDGRAYFNQTAYRGIFASMGLNKKRLAYLARIAFKYFHTIFALDKDVDRLEKSFPEVLKSSACGSTPSKIIHLKRQLDNYMSLHIQIAGCMDIGFLIIRKTVGKYVAKDRINALVDGLVTGMGTIESTAFGESLWSLASLIKNNKALIEAITDAPCSIVPELLIKWGGIYGNKWQEFLDRYGHSALHEFEIYYPRWVEDPSFIVTTLRQYLHEVDIINSREDRRNLSKKNIVAENTLLESVPRVYRLPLRFYINHVRKCSMWRELLKQKLVKIMFKLRKEALALGSECGISPTENVFFLSLEELLECNGHPISPGLLEKAAHRKEQWQERRVKDAYQEIRIYPDGRQLKIPYHSDGGNNMKGVSLSSGTYVGKARVVLDPANISSFNWGDILVAPSTNPSWTPIFVLAGAIVTDMGNYLSHGAIVARELGIPAVGNLFTATKSIKDGEIIFVDGDKGTVQTIEKELSDA